MYDIFSDLLKPFQCKTTALQPIKK